MPAKMTFFPIGNADTTRIDLANGQTVLVDYANMRCPDDDADCRCDLPVLLRQALKDANRDFYDVVCFTHLDNDHVKGAADFFWLRHASKYQSSDRIKINEMWVPAAVITEDGLDGDARIIRQEARYRLEKGEGIKVFSRPERLHDFLASRGLTEADRAHCIVDAGQLVPGFSKFGSAKAEFFVHSPFAWRVNDREVEDRNQDSIVFQVTFSEGGNDTYAICGSDVDYDTLSKIVQTTKRHGREDRLLWDVLKLFHHCSYLSLGPDRGVDETVAVPDVKWLFETQSRDGCVIVSPSDPIPLKGTTDDKDVQPPHRQAANHHRRVVDAKAGDFKVTMETPNRTLPKPLEIEITGRGTRLSVVAPTVIGTITSTSARAG
jgi:hypothetical protein